MVMEGGGKRRPFAALSGALLLSTVTVYVLLHLLRSFRPSTLSFEETQIRKAVDNAHKEICRMGGSSAGKTATDPRFDDAMHSLYLSLGMGTKKALLNALLDLRGEGVVVDVGAHRGYLLTFPALLAERVVYAVEPDTRNSDFLIHQQQKRKYPSSGLHLVRNAAGDAERIAPMSFHKDRDDYSCFRCLDTSRQDVYVENVSVVMMDNLVKEPVHIFKSDTQGYELQVLKGSAQVFDDHGVRFAIIEFDPKLLAAFGSATGREVIDFFLNRDYRCFDLLWKGISGSAHFHEPLFEHNADDFINELRGPKAYTDIFCMRCLD